MAALQAEVADLRADLQIESDRRQLGPITPEQIDQAREFIEGHPELVRRSKLLRSLGERRQPRWSTIEKDLRGHPDALRAVLDGEGGVSGGRTEENS